MINFGACVCKYVFHVVAYPSWLNMSDLLVMTFVSTSDNIYYIFCKYVVSLNFLNFHVILVTSC